MTEPTTDWAAWWTFGLTCVTAVLAYFTYRLYSTTVKMRRDALNDSMRQREEVRAALQVSEKAAAAAQRSADALLLTERAYVGVQVALQLATGGPIETPTVYSVTVHFVNHGRTPATLVWIRGQLVVEWKVPQSLQDHGLAQIRLPAAFLIQSGGYHELPVERLLMPQEWAEIAAGQMQLFCLGEIRYRDVLGEERTTGYCWHYSDFNNARGFIPSPNTPLNYIE
jgi:hypothetical protein